MTDPKTYNTTWTDEDGDAWTMQLDAPTIQLIREQHAIDLDDISAPETWARLDNDTVCQVNVLHAVCQRQCDQRGISPTDFARRLGPGDIREHAYNALLDAVELFIPPRRRLLWRALVAKHQTIQTKALEMAAAKIDDPNLQTRILSELSKQMDSAVDEKLTALQSPTATPER